MELCSVCRIRRPGKCGTIGRNSRLHLLGGPVDNDLRMPVALAEVSITHELLSRVAPAPDYLREKLALQDLAQQMADNPEGLLPHLVQQAMDICDADSSGISVLEGDVFRWLGLAGKLSVFEGATTPRDFSPCGVCIDQRSAVLMERPERLYRWIADANITVPEVLLVPLLVNGTTPIGTLWIVAHEGQHFDRGHERVMTELATFTGIALRMVQSDIRLKKALDEQETLAKEMSHRVKNLFAITDSMIRLTSRSVTTKEEMTESLSGRLHALANAHGLVRRSFSLTATTKGVELGELINAILRPYRKPILSGGAVHLGEHATNSIALVFHELATNAAKYGALSSDHGSIDVAWSVEDGKLDLEWRERSGHDIQSPAKKGFGSTLVETTISGHGGTLDREWSPQGLIVRIKIPTDRLAR
jgi:two-component sensor histidine kinase